MVWPELGELCIRLLTEMAASGHRRASSFSRFKTEHVGTTKDKALAAKKRLRDTPG